MKPNVSTASGKNSSLYAPIVDVFEHKPENADTQQQVVPMINEESFPDLSPTPCCCQLPISIAPEILAMCPYTAEYAELVLKWTEKVHWP